MFAQATQRFQRQTMILDRIQASDLNDDERVLVEPQFAAHGVASAGFFRAGLETDAVVDDLNPGPGDAFISRKGAPNRFTDGDDAVIAPQEAALQPSALSIPPVREEAAMFREENARASRKHAARQEGVEKWGRLVGVNQFDALVGDESAQAAKTAKIKRTRSTPQRNDLKAFGAKLFAERSVVVEATDDDLRRASETPCKPRREQFGAADLQAMNELKRSWVGLESSAWLWHRVETFRREE